MSSVAASQNERWDIESPPRQALPAFLIEGQGPRLPHPYSQNAQAFFAPSVHPHPRPRMHRVPSDEELPNAEDISVRHPLRSPQPGLSNPPQPHIDLTASSQSSSNTGVWSQPPTNALGHASQRLDLTRLVPVQPIPASRDPQLNDPHESMPFFELTSSPSTASAGTIDLTADTPRLSESENEPPMPPKKRGKAAVVGSKEGKKGKGGNEGKGGRGGKGGKGKTVDPEERKAGKQVGKAGKAEKAGEANSRPSKRPRTSKKVEDAAAALTDGERAELAVPMDESSGGSDESDLGDETETEAVVKKSQRIDEETKLQAILWWFDPETYQQHRKSKPESLKKVSSIIL
jgi:hypothetical protein